MSASKEEREHWRGRLQALREKGESEVAINLYTFSDVLNQLDRADERIADLQRENQRLNYMLRYIDATSVDRRLTMKANEAWLNKRDREDA